jgi:hypothetical protein
MGSREEFIDSWLNEQPERLTQPLSGVFPDLVLSIRERRELQPVTDLGSCKAIIGKQTSYYWMEDSSGDIILAMETSTKPQCLAVNGSGKDPDHFGRPPFAQDLYRAALASQPLALRLMSDTTLSDGGISVWKRFVRDGYSISIYDREQPGRTFKKIVDANDLDAYVGGRDSRRFQFVLSKGTEMLSETQAFFATRRMREKSGML